MYDDFQLDFNLWDYSPVWEVLMTFAIILGVVLLANLLRRTIKPVKKLLLPSPVTGGFLLLFIGGLWTLITGVPMVQTDFLEIITYHGFGLGFTAIAMKVVTKKREKAGRDVFNSALVAASSYVLYAVLGLAISITLFLTIDIFFASGMLLSMSFAGGPGMALIWGSVYETHWGFTHGTSFALSLVATGYLACSIGGAIYLNGLKRKGDPRVLGKLSDDDYVEEPLKPEDVSAPDEIPMSDSVDKLTVQFGLVIFAYMVGFGIISFLSHLTILSNVEFLVETLMPMLWSFNFIFGTLSGVLVKKVLLKGMEKGLVKRQYINNLFMDRVAGFFFDVMVIAALGAISLIAFRETSILIPMIVMSIIGAVVTYFYIKDVTKRLFPTYEQEAFLGFYGMMTGTASTGVILLREIDPRFETPTAKNMVYQTVFAAMMGLPLLMFVGIAPQSPQMTYLSFGILTVMFIGFYVWIRLAARKVKKDMN